MDGADLDAMLGQVNEVQRTLREKENEEVIAVQELEAIRAEIREVHANRKGMEKNVLEKKESISLLKNRIIEVEEAMEAMREETKGLRDAVAVVTAGCAALDSDNEKVLRDGEAEFALMVAHNKEAATVFETLAGHAEVGTLVALLGGGKGEGEGKGGSV